VQLISADCDRADRGQHEEVALGLDANSGFHTRIVRWT